MRCSAPSSSTSPHPGTAVVLRWWRARCRSPVPSPRRATLQALLGEWLVRTCVGLPQHPHPETDAVRLLLLGGPFGLHQCADRAMDAVVRGPHRDAGPAVQHMDLVSALRFHRRADLRAADLRLDAAAIGPGQAAAGAGPAADPAGHVAVILFFSASAREQRIRSEFERRAQQISELRRQWSNRLLTMDASAASYAASIEVDARNYLFIESCCSARPACRPSSSCRG